jgi:hypothetical protein
MFMNKRFGAIVAASLLGSTSCAEKPPSSLEVFDSSRGALVRLVLGNNVYLEQCPVSFDGVVGGRPSEDVLSCPTFVVVLPRGDTAERFFKQRRVPPGDVVGFQVSSSRMPSGN